MESATRFQIKLVTIARIEILNPRDRNRKKFQELVSSIAEVGLKRPITVTKSEKSNNGQYELVCGQGRLEAFNELGQTEIPAIVINANTETALVKSLVENCARRQHNALDIVHDIGGMKERGYSYAEIGRKTGLSVEYVRGVGKLLQEGEDRLLKSVEAGHIPVSVAVESAQADDESIQSALQNAYENNILRGRKLLIAKRLIERRSLRKKGNFRSQASKKRISSNALVKAYQEDADRKKLLIRKADATRNRLIFIAHAVRELLCDEDFVELLKAESLDTIPKKLAARMDRQELTR